MNNYNKFSGQLRHPRTLNEAFGPYTSNEIQDSEPFTDWDGIWIVVGCMALGLAGWVIGGLL